MRFRDDSDIGLVRDMLRVMLPEGEGTATPDFEYEVTKARDELRYTLGPLYAPNFEDAHGEFVTEDDLRKAVWEYVDTSDHVIRKQHGREMIGQVRENVQWPSEITTEVTRADTGEVRKVTYPAGTVFLGVQWSKEAWPLVKKGKIRGYSLGGGAMRLRGEKIPV